MRKPAPSSVIEMPGRPGHVMDGVAESKSCLKPKRSRMVRVEYRTASQLGHDEHVGELVTSPADSSTVVEIDQSSADGLNTREAVGSVDADAGRAIW